MQFQLKTKRINDLVNIKNRTIVLNLNVLITKRKNVKKDIDNTHLKG